MSKSSKIGRDFGYVRRPQNHGISGCDWNWLLDFADRHVNAKSYSAVRRHPCKP